MQAIHLNDKNAIVLGFVNEAPKPSNNPATGKIETGRKNALPIVCNVRKI